MARALLVAFAVCVVRGDEYTGGSMPQYGAVGADYEVPPRGAGLSDDYRGHSPDAPAQLDYKYQEEPHGEAEKRIEQVDEDEHRPRSSGRRRPTREDIEPANAGAEYEPELKPSRRHSRRKDRSWRSSRREESASSRRHAASVRERHRHAGLDYFESDGDDRFREEKNDHRDDFARTSATTARVIRRKPRDRYFAEEGAMKSIPSDEEDILRRPTQADNWLESRERPAGAGRAPPPVPGLLDHAPAEEPEQEPGRDNEFEPKPRMRFNKYKNYPEYGDYYDMKRVNNIKSKLPTLLHRTSTTLMGAQRTAASELVRALWPERRAGDGLQVAPSPTTAVSVSTTPKLDASTAPTTTTVPPRSSLVEATTTAPPMRHFTRNDTELSMAEKSRLSILKKAQLKESLKSASSKKPPVLLHVASRVPTVVMVEPGTTGYPWMRAREVSDDSPETLEKVKRLMRMKLVAQSKNIHELTDDWDQLVCDYIDTSMIDEVSRASLLVSSLATYLVFLSTFIAFNN